MARICFIILSLMLMVTSSFAYYDTYADFPGPYCKTRRDPCCHDREDDCSVKIDTTLCYCDEFCVREVNSDCCPDYRPVCLGISPPQQIVQCYHKGQYITQFGLPARDNCNLCHCRDGVTECETDVCLIDESSILKINRNSHLGWSAKNYTEFWGHKYSEGLRLRLGTFEPKFHIARIKHKPEELPRSFNAVEHWGGLISEIRDQGWCGSSWALSTASVASDRFSIQSKGREFVNLGPQQILSCARKQQGCNGGHLDVAWNYFRKFGLVEEDCYPYESKRGICKVKQTDNLRTLGCRLPTKVPRVEMYKTGPAYSIKTVNDVMIEIKHYGPVQATMKIYHDFFTYGGGIYRHSASSATDEFAYHSVKIVGWGEERVGYDLTKYWIVANSWGTWWGEDGYFRILRGSNECDIEKYILASWASEHQHEKQVRRHRNNNLRRV